jgi:hypothetical protein
VLSGEEHGAIAPPLDAALAVVGKVLCFGGTDDTDVAPCESLAFPPPSEVSANQPPRRASELKHAAAMMPT